MTRTSVFLVGGIALLAITPAAGHHAYGSYYFEDQSISVEGDVVELDYRNPHAWVHIHSADIGGKVQRVSAEWASPGRLSQQGINKDTLKPGDRVVITGSPSRDESQAKMHLKGIERRADGWTWVGRDQRR